MHQVLRIPEILLHIFGYFSTESGRRSPVDLAVFARTCRTFKEPALDLLWEELDDRSPLARCLPRAYHSVEHTKHVVDYCQIMSHYTFSRPPTEAEWIALRSYTRRVRLIRSSFAKIGEEAISMVLSLAPFDDPLFPQLRSLYWNGTTSVLPHIVTPSLKTLHLCPNYMHILTSKKPLSFDTLGDRCPDMEDLRIDSPDQVGPMDNLAISDLVCRWPKLQRVACPRVALNMDAISHLSSVSSLESLEFSMETSLVQDISQLGSKLIFSSLTFLKISSKILDTITLFLRHIRLPAIETLSVDGHTSRQAVSSYWAAVREACPSNVLTSLIIHGSLVGEERPCLTLDDLRPCTFFANLRRLDIDFWCLVSLTDADLLELASPRMECLSISSKPVWQANVDPGGITLSGLVRLLQKCPSLGRVCVALDTRTFCEIPEGMDVSFPARGELSIDVLDSYIFPELVPGLVSTFTALGPCVSLLATQDIATQGASLWECVSDALHNGLKRRPM